MNTAIFLLSLSCYFSFIEGFRETAFYNINRAAKFALPKEDGQVKTCNAFTATVVIGLLAYILNVYPLIPLAYALRMILLDGVLNVRRNIGFWAVGERDIVGRTLKSLPLPLWLSKLLIVAITAGLSYLFQTYSQC